MAGMRTIGREGTPTLAKHKRGKIRTLRTMQSARRKWNRGVWKANYELIRKPSSQRGYDHRWKKLRDSVLARQPECALCGKGADVVDHVIPHKGSTRLFWEVSNLQPLCHSCHNSKTRIGL